MNQSPTAPIDGGTITLTQEQLQLALQRGHAMWPGQQITNVSIDGKTLVISTSTPAIVAAGVRPYPE